MNKYIQDYISQKKSENKEYGEKNLSEILNNLHIGEREYLGDYEGAPLMDFPFYDMERNDYYRYNVGEVTDEEFEELLKYVPENVKNDGHDNGKIGFWYCFSIVLMFVCIIGGISIWSNEGWIPGVSVIIGSIVFFSQIILLSKIEYNTRNRK